jgi:hypothetical protein
MNLSEFEMITAASYQLAEGSLCIDAGDVASLSNEILLDLAGESRVQGSQIDIGAYEFKVQTSIPGILPENERAVKVKEGIIYITGTKKNEMLMIYNLSGNLVYKRRLNSGSESVKSTDRGIYFLKIQNEVFKLLIQ